MELTEQQNEAKNKIEKWFCSIHPEKYHFVQDIKSERSRIFVLAGYAGTGKTTLIKYMIDNVLGLSESDVAFAAPTGKAASVLIQRGTRNACTIHKLIYVTDVDETQTFSPNGTRIIKKSLRFIKRNNIDGYKLIVLDEISMIPKNIMIDLLSFGIPILATGDMAQLPPVMAESNGLLDNPDAMLTDIVRQSADNQIVQISTKIRLKQPVQFGDYGNGQVEILDRHTLNSDDIIGFMTSADQVICGLNATRSKLNKSIRNKYGYCDPTPMNGEKLICDLNNYFITFGDNGEYPLVNGMLCECKNFKIVDKDLGLAAVSIKPDFIENDKWADGVLCESSPFGYGDFKYEKHQTAYLLESGNYAIRKQLFKRSPYETKEDYRKNALEERTNKRNSVSEEMINQLEFGYAISCHKSQGSEWDSVVVIDESGSFRQDCDRWLYTACTRAKKRLIIIR
jgi:exodeoxyribonuclease-5